MLFKNFNFSNSSIGVDEYMDVLEIGECTIVKESKRRGKVKEKKLYNVHY